MHKIVPMLLMLFAAGCSKADPPCPPGARGVSGEEADEALTRKATKEAAGGRGDGTAVTSNCTGSGKKREVKLTFEQILDCVTKTIPLAQDMGYQMDLALCIANTSAIEFAKAVLGLTGSIDNAPMDLVLKVDGIASKARCVEVSRNVEIKADDHGLNRINGDGFVPATIWWILTTMGDAAMAPAGSPALFLLKPKADEEACVDLPEPPGNRCTSADGCEEPTWEDPNDLPGGGVIPVGTDPGIPTPDNGDHL